MDREKRIYLHYNFIFVYAEVKSSSNVPPVEREASGNPLGVGWIKRSSIKTRNMKLEM